MYYEIIERVYLHFNRVTYHGYANLVHDNAPQHKSDFTLRTLQAWNVKIMDWPPESLDLNPIELIWGNMKNYIRKKNVRNVDDLRDSIFEYWKILTPEVCRNYICGIRKKWSAWWSRRGETFMKGGRRFHPERTFS
ncbi:hypothetical protein ANCCAN_24521 [Ancylostoma caninum]|uniref:Tc1-like transposase DDE domain-containing protein n=1 Tax=Ancylostoma caninum TaxID=29170 RepID=A0A368FDP7_ANCCA|nr:hypothetical protein ANCCAN_24521 [Ancylostoma caninum]